MVFDAISFFKSSNHLRKVVPQDFVVDENVFLMATQKIQLVNFHVNSLLFP